MPHEGVNRSLLSSSTRATISGRLLQARWVIKLSSMFEEPRAWPSQSSPVEALKVGARALYAPAAEAQHLNEGASTYILSSGYGCEQRQDMMSRSCLPTASGLDDSISAHSIGRWRHLRHFHLHHRPHCWLGDSIRERLAPLCIDSKTERTSAAAS